MSKKVTVSLGPIPFLVFIVFLALKLTGVVDWSWWWVTCPLWLLWLPALVVVGMGAMALVLACIVMLLSKSQR